MSDLDPLLFGANPLTNAVAVEPDSKNGRMVVLRREPDGSTSETGYPFSPWLISAEPVQLRGSVLIELDGNGYRYKYSFPDSGWNNYYEAVRSLRDRHLPIVSYGSQVRQFLIESGITLFKGMVFDDLKRMQVDIETTTLSPADLRAQIVLIAISDNRGNVKIVDGDEPSMIDDFVATVRSWDPDVIEGHNIYNFDLPYLIARAKASGVEFNIGRDPDRPIQVGPSRNCAMGANSRPFIPIYIDGRHIVDTYFQVQRFDAAKGEISSYGLKECARVYHLSMNDRIVVDRSKVAEIFAKNPEILKEYAEQDVVETGLLAALVSPTEFYQTQMCPDVYQSISVTGTGEKVNSLLVREYLRRGKSIPISSLSSEYPGGYTEVRRVGLVRRVVKADVESLYPSLMLAEKIKPASDTLNLFLPMLSDLTERRLAAKSMLRETPRLSRDYAYWDGLQNSFKILINSFYGYIGGPFYFNDYKAARQVTESGQRTVKALALELEQTGSQVIEIDTDGIYFQPPESIQGMEEEEKYVQMIGSILPKGIRLAHDGRYSAMLSLKIKNYVLVDYEGKRIMKGSSLRSRADEPFGRRFLNDAVDRLLQEDYDGFSKLYKTTLSAILDGGLTITDYSKRERITEKSINGAMRSKFGELVKGKNLNQGEIVNVYNRTDGSIALEIDYQSDEDRAHYATKLYKFAQRLIEAVGEENFDRLCPKPKSIEQRLIESLQVSFDF